VVITEHVLGARFAPGRRIVPLPEDEQRQLREIERALYAGGLVHGLSVVIWDQ